MIRIRWNWPALIDDGQIRIALLLPKLRSKAKFQFGISHAHHNSFTTSERQLCFGVPDHADRAALMSLDMLFAIQDFNASSQHPLNIRIGMSTGSAVAGIIGKTKFLYDLWGDVVNTASRMESQGVAGRIQITDATRQALGHPFLLERRGTIEVTGKGEMATWFLNGRNM